MDKKESRRILMTKAMLKSALVELLHEKDIYHISIKTLCERANINRTTFYKYYGSQFDLLGDMEDDVVSFIDHTVVKNRTDIETLIRTFCEYLEDNIDFAKMLINNSIDSDFPKKIFSLPVIKSVVIDSLPDRMDENECDYYCNFLTYGVYRVISMWINKENRESPTALSKVILKMTVERSANPHLFCTTNQ